MYKLRNRLGDAVLGVLFLAAASVYGVVGFLRHSELEAVSAYYLVLFLFAWLVTIGIGFYLLLGLGHVSLARVRPQPKVRFEGWGMTKLHMGERDWLLRHMYLSDTRTGEFLREWEEIIPVTLPVDEFRELEEMLRAQR